MKCFLQPIILFGVFVPGVFGQCVGATTTTNEAEGVLRTGSNQVYTIAQSWVSGQYASTWTSYVSTTTTVNGGTIHTGSTYASSGGTATLDWYDTPSTLGSGTWAEADTHSFTNSCMGSAGPYNYTPSLTVATPTISGGQNFWNLGPSTADPTTSSVYPGDSYVQSVAITANQNCNAGDTCTDTPSWSINPNSQVTLSSSSGSSVTMNHTSTIGDCGYDTTISFSVGGFSSSAIIVAVNSPDFLVHHSEFDYTASWGSHGYQSSWFYAIADMCSPANAITSLPIYESFGATWNKDSSVTSGWPSPSASSSSDFNGSLYLFFDDIGEAGAYTPLPTYDAVNAPFMYSTPLLWDSQTWYAGATSGGGYAVGSGTITYYQDHGTGAVN